MGDYDIEFHRCLDKGKAIKNKLNRRSENNTNNTPSRGIDYMIKDSLDEFSNMIRNLKILTTKGNVSNQELNRRNDNNNKLEEMLLQYQKQMKIDKIDLSIAAIPEKDKIKDSYNENMKKTPKKMSSDNNNIINIDRENNKKEQEENINFKTKDQFLQYKEKKFEEGDEFLSELQGKTKIIKKHALMINDTLDKQKPLLERMDIDMTRVNDKAKRTENKLANYLKKSSNSCLMYAIVIEFVILLLFFVM